MNILIITHSYAPDPRPRAFRWTAIAEAWAAKGFRVDVVTTGRRGGQAHDRQAGVYVHRVGERLLQRFARPHANGKGTAPTNGTGARRLGRSVRLIAKFLHDYTWKKIYWPDYACLWIRSALNEAKRLCRSRQYDGVITVSHPFTGHLVGQRLKSEFSKLKWVVDIGDPFGIESTVPSNNLSLFEHRNRRAEASVLAECDAVSVTVEGCKRIFVDEYSVGADKIRVIPPLLSLSTDPPEGPAPFTKNGCIDLVYLGVLYATIRRPDAVLALFAALHTRMERIRLHFIGDIQGCDDVFARYPNLMNRSIFRYEVVTRNRVPAVLSSSDALINIGNDTEHQLPSKLVEYVAMGRPILNVVAKETDTSVEFLKNYKRALTITCPDNAPSDAQLDQVLAFLQNTPKMSQDCLDRFVGDFRLEPICTAYEDLIAENRQSR